MKTILALTDLSSNAAHAAQYAYHFAVEKNADLILCNAFMVPTLAPEAGMVAWPAEEYAILSEESAAELKNLEEQLKINDHRVSPDAFRPKITVLSETGDICNTVNCIDKKNKICLVVAGTHNKSGLSDLLTGNAVNGLVNNIAYPLLLVPPNSTFTQTKKALFATDLTHIKKDVTALIALANLLAPMDGEIVLTHICKPDVEENEDKRNLLRAMIEKTGLSNLTYKLVHDPHPENALEVLSESDGFDMLVMLHRPHSLFARLFTNSHSQKMAKKVTIPLLVMPSEI